MDPNFTCAVLGISDPNGKAIDVGHLILTSPGLSANATTKDHQGLRNRGLRVCLENWGSSVRTTGYFFFKNISGIIQVYLVGGFNHLEKYESMGRIIPYMENKKSLKPPTRYHSSNA